MKLQTEKLKKLLKKFSKNKEAAGAQNKTWNT